MIKLLKNIFGRAVGSSNGSRRAQQPVLPVAAPVAPKHQGNAKSKHAPPHGTKSSATAAPQQKPGEPDGDLNLPLTAVLNGL
ncbi:MAG TPA: hypothetical protein VK327_11990, partial [Candidatus Paceibacterota bacterium]|nr:hypothetical protein [Candidatus Paceibacterota bacterium]